MQDMHEEARGFSIHYKSTLLRRNIFLGILMTALALFVSWSAWNTAVKTANDFIALLISPPFSLFLIFLTFRFSYLLNTKQPALEITKSGILHNHILGNTKRVAWNDISSLVIYQQTNSWHKPFNTLDVLSHRSPDKPLLRILTDNLEQSSQDIASSIRVFAQYVEDVQDIAIEDKVSQTSSSTSTSPGLTGYGAWVISAIIFSTISIGSRMACHQVNQSILQNSREASINRDIAGWDQVVAQNPTYLAIKQADPEGYDRFRQSLIDGLRAGTTQHELEIKANKFCNDFMQNRLKHASADTLKKYLQLRLESYGNSLAVSPEFMYSNVMSGTIDLDQVPSQKRTAYIKNQQQSVEKMASIITALPSDNPISQNDRLLDQRVPALVAQLTDAEREAFHNEGKPEVDKAVYCQAVIHLYTEGLKLPAEEVVQVFRSLGQLPTDDRLPSSPNVQEGP